MAAGELAVDIATVAGTGYGVYKATKGSDSGTAAPSIPSIQTGDNSPVQINVGSGTASQHNPNTTTSTSSTGARRH